MLPIARDKSRHGTGGHYQSTQRKGVASSGEFVMVALANVVETHLFGW